MPSRPYSLPLPKVGFWGLLLLAGGCASAPPDPNIQARIAVITPEAARRDVETLTQSGPRSYLDASRLTAAKQYLTAELEKAGFTVQREAIPPPALNLPTITHPARLENGVLIPETTEPLYKFENLIVEIRGERDPERVLEFGAHYDTVPGSPGADDNTSGVAGLLAVARCLAGGRHERTVRLCFFDLEEASFEGSVEHVRRLPPASRERNEGIIVFEMIGYTSADPAAQRMPLRVPLLFDPPQRADTLFILGNLNSGSLADRFEAAARRYVPALPLYAAGRVAGFSTYSAWSDNRPYWQAERRGVMLTDTAFFRNPHYHRPSDTADTLDYEFLSRVAQAAAATALEWARPLPPAPTR